MKRQQPQAAESTPTDDSLLPLPAIRGSVPDILRQPLRRTSSLRYLVTCSHQKVTLGTGNYKGPGFWISAPACRKTGGRRSTPSPSHQQAVGSRSLACCDHFKISSLQPPSHAHEIRSGGPGLGALPASAVFCSFAQHLLSPENLLCASDPTAVCIARLTLSNYSYPLHPCRRKSSVRNVYPRAYLTSPSLVIRHPGSVKHAYIYLLVSTTPSTSSNFLSMSPALASMTMTNMTA